MPRLGGLMQALLVLLAIGFVAQLIDGALGMAYGATSSSLVLAAGLACHRLRDGTHGRDRYDARLRHLAPTLR
jgi:hypothetical protein